MDPLEAPSLIWVKKAAPVDAMEHYRARKFLDRCIASCAALFIPHQEFKEAFMNNVPLQPIIAILAGILILLRPALLNYVVALYLIIVGILGLMGSRRI